MGSSSPTPPAAASTDGEDASLAKDFGTLSVTGKSKPARQVRYKPEKATLRRGSGTVIPTRFDDTVYTRNPSSATVPSCVNAYAVIESGRAGWAAEFGGDYIISGRLENTGPFGDANMLDGITPSALRLRAHLRAVIAALRCPSLATEGHKSIVVCTSEPKILKRATILIRNWLSNGWLGPARNGGQPAATDSTLPSTNGSALPSTKDNTLPSTKDGKPRKTRKKTLPEPHKPPPPKASNKEPPPTILDYDLWELLLGECERYKEKGLAVQIYYIKGSDLKWWGRHLRREALAACRKEACEEFQDVFLA